MWCVCGELQPFAVEVPQQGLLCVLYVVSIWIVKGFCCGLLKGFYAGSPKQCTFNAVRWSQDTNVTCSPCPAFTTTAQEGSVLPDLCALCVPGRGGDACLTQCGGVGPLASYGPPGRTVGTPCLPCSTSKTGFSFDWQTQNDLFQSRAISRAGATRPCDCLSEFQQLVDGAWYIRTTDMPDPAAGNATTNSSANSFNECVAQCTGPQCMWVTYSYKTRHCYTSNSPVPLTFAG